jgi:hypothetical protein
MQPSSVGVIVAPGRVPYPDEGFPDDVFGGSSCISRTLFPEEKVEAEATPCPAAPAAPMALRGLEGGDPGVPAEVSRRKFVLVGASRAEDGSMAVVSVEKVSSLVSFPGVFGFAGVEANPPSLSLLTGNPAPGTAVAVDPLSLLLTDPALGLLRAPVRTGQHDGPIFAEPLPKEAWEERYRQSLKRLASAAGAGAGLALPATVTPQAKKRGPERTPGSAGASAFFVEWDMTQPSLPSPPPAPAGDQALALASAIEYWQRVFAARPVILRRLLRPQADNPLLKQALAHVASLVSRGPAFRWCFIRFGFDPRADPLCFRYQTVAIRGGGGEGELTVQVCDLKDKTLVSEASLDAQRQNGGGFVLERGFFSRSMMKMLRTAVKSNSAIEAFELEKFRG